MNYKFLPLLLSLRELPDFDPNLEDDPDQNLFDALINQQKLIVIDWKGEQNKYEIGNFINDRAGQIQGNEGFDFTDAYQKAEEKSAGPGDFVPALIKNIQGELKRSGLEVVQLDRGNDSYYIGLIKQENSKALKKASDGFWKFRTFGSQTGEVLYTVYCSCGSMNVWQLKRGELLTDDTCQNCGRIIFDEKGRSEFEVIKDYI